MSAPEIAPRGSSTVRPDGRSGLRLAGIHDAIQTGGHSPRRTARQRAERDLGRVESRFALVAGSRTGTAPVIELRPRLRGAGRRTTRAVELTLVLSAVAIAVTLALLPGPAATGSSGVPTGPPGGVRSSCATAAVPACR